MSALHHGYFAAHRGPDGLLIIDRAENGNTAGFWRNADPQVLNAIPNPEVKVEADGALPIPAQRAGSAYEQKVLTADPADLADPSDLVPIPQLSTFAHALRGATQTPKEAL